MTAPRHALAPGVQERIRCLAPRLHELGPNPLFHCLVDLARGGELLETLEQYARLPPELIYAYRADKLPPPMMLLRGGRR
jgi:hypothetical protein